MSTIGGEIGQLQSLKANFDRQSQSVNELTAAIRGELGNTWWKGPAADRFRDAWSGEFEPALRKLEAALQEAGTEVARRREALIQAGS
ncbi:MAG TPA: WXG100 family type VII secretion target [Actinomycetota bacterium]|nr:WXG100 family type VII secretion target [Actinomycetota bacterium]